MCFVGQSVIGQSREIVGEISAFSGKPDFKIILHCVNKKTATNKCNGSFFKNYHCYGIIQIGEVGRSVPPVAEFQLS
jgi:hypothetical protein